MAAVGHEHPMVLHCAQEVTASRTFVVLALESAPALLLAFAVAGLMRVFIRSQVLEWLGRGSAVGQSVKADLAHASVAAASVLAKVTRDRRMTELAGEADRYGWAVNKGYTTPEHADAIRRHGLCEQHRRSWGIAAAAPVDLTAHKAGPPVVIPS